MLTVDSKISILKLVGASYLDNRRSQSSLICDCANQLVRIGCSELLKVVSKCCKQRYRCFDFHETPKHNVMCCFVRELTFDKVTIKISHWVLQKPISFQDYFRGT